MNKTALALLLVSSAAAAFAEAPEITNIRAVQRENSKLVDIWYDAADADGDTLRVRIEISDDDGARFNVPVFSLTGDVGDGIEPREDLHVVWDAGTDWDGEYSDRMRVKIIAVDSSGCPDLEWSDEVPAGGFLLGQDGGAEGSGASRHVSIPWPFRLSKYEITAKQYCDFLNMAQSAGLIQREGTSAIYTVPGKELIKNIDGKFLLLQIGDSRRIRWNVSKYEVTTSKTDYTDYPASVTWYGAMAWAHFYGYDLPTEAEWEMTARGPEHGAVGTHWKYTWGDDETSTKGYVQRNATSSTDFKIGSRQVGYFNGVNNEDGPDVVNGYGCYDMSGNADEWTRTLHKCTVNNILKTFDVSDYPATESLGSDRNIYWNRDTPSFVFKHGLPIWGRVAGTTRGNALDPQIGFRVCRRSIEAE